ncbi:MAG: cation transporter, partial [Alphaproteobacteria bacterium]|nr:cation transporter [Alphaproteobacteria bacterium]
YANSITLTPGTLTTDVKEGEIEVHALSRYLMDDLIRSEMDRRVTELEADK